MVTVAAAHEAATRAKISEIALYLQGLLGQKLTALIADVRDPKAVGAWARGERSPHPRAEHRLREAYHIALLLRQSESVETVRSWFIGMNPLLDDQAPALVIAADKESQALQAARAFLAS